MYASALRLASEVMEDDHVKIGENGLLYRVSKIARVTTDGQEFVVFQLYYTLDATQTTVAVLALTAHQSLMIYNQ